METKVAIKGMSCPHCVKSVQQALDALPGVDSVTVTVGEAVIRSSMPVDLAKVRAAVEDIGFEMA